MALDVERRKIDLVHADFSVGAPIVLDQEAGGGTDERRTGVNGIQGDHRVRGLVKHQEGEVGLKERGRRTNARLTLKGADLARHGIDPDRVRVQSTSGVTLESLGVDVDTILRKLVHAHEHARKNQILGNQSGRYFSSNLMLGNGQWGIGTNIENSRDVGVFCGERSAMITAWNQALEKLDLADLEAGHRPDMSVKLLVLSNPDEIGSSPYCPCSECQSWMATDQYWGPDTVLIGAEKDPASTDLVLNLQRVKDILPVHTDVQVTRPAQSLDRLQVATTDAARTAMQEKGVAPEKLVEALKAAKQAGSTSSTSEFSGVFDAAATLMSDGSIFEGVRFDWTARWTDPADLKAASDGVVFLKKRNQPANIDAVAYFGDKPPSVHSLGVLGQPTRGGPDTLIVTVEKSAEQDQIQVRTIKDLMPQLYISSSAARQREATERVSDLVRRLAGSKTVDSGATRADMRPEPPRHRFTLPEGGAQATILGTQKIGIGAGARALQAKERVCAYGPELKDEASLTLELSQPSEVTKVKDLDDEVIRSAGFGSRADLMKRLNLKPSSTVTVFTSELDSIRLASGN